jgi:ribosomal subunit interface protein
MEVVVTGRHCEVSERFREHVTDKLARLEKYDHRIIRVNVEVEPERNQGHVRAIKVELTAFSKGPVIRAESAAEEKLAAFENSLDKMASQMRRANERRIARRRHPGVGAVTAGLPAEQLAPLSNDLVEELTDEDSVTHRQVGPIEVTGDGPLVVREKSHQATPMTLDQALYEMELVGHDFFLFVDKESEKPSVVYRRKGYDYGVISLEVDSES